MMTDSIADLLTRIRNAIHARHELLEIPYSKIKLGILDILQREGYIRSFQNVMQGTYGKILVTLRYNGIKRDPVITTLNRISKPGRRVYVASQEIKPVLAGMGVAIISTSKGLMTDKQAKEARMGGELLCTVW